MITRDQALLILSKMVPHALTEDKPDTGVTPNHWHMTERALNSFGITEQELKGHDFFYGAETHHKGRVMVFEKDKLEAFAGTQCGFNRASTTVGSVSAPRTRGM